ncbi:putative thiosulfate sulfurtransferase, mitochondrial [Zancudomyces culisetae]|uniref:Putative thiosulfate sulfurtransferase, mitochondrial n=1 Tax=Zancudomyces culisetae TaxID=1213189 RepID=A0A1R1PVD8_ZANCU|nr:putative thiosulfate sulfurtransferase, mitochondrial [Zancudomyces culisetae]|eukprot:OMH84923.1 putative thiosulfate sulfurtransferase, mitochondrial [Zancudomyces culisetae]
MSHTTIGYEEVCQISKKEKLPGATIIDVRNPGEYGSGHIPGAHNIPHTEISAALQLNDDEFEKKYNFKRPQKNDQDHPVVLYCLAGKRCLMAADAMQSLGYSSGVLVYENSWNEYSKKSGL